MERKQNKRDGGAQLMQKLVVMAESAGWCGRQQMYRQIPAF